MSEAVLTLAVGLPLMASWAFFAWIGHTLGEHYGRFAEKLDLAESGELKR